MQHCKVFLFSLLHLLHSRSKVTFQVISIGDCSKHEAKMYFFDRLVPSVPDSMQETLAKKFEELYDAFGGKLAHWSDFVTDYGIIFIYHLNRDLEAKGVSSECERELDKLVYPSYSIPPKW